MAEKKTTRPTGTRELWGIVILTAALLMLLALISYDWADISLLRAPPNDPLRNFIGPAGAWFAFVALTAVGLSAFLIPFTTALLGIMLLAYPRQRFWPHCLWSLFFVLFASALTTLYPDWAADLCDHLNIFGLAGGLAGWLLADKLLAALLGRAGATVLLAGLLSASILMFIGREPIVAAFQRLLAVMVRGVSLLQAARAARRSRLEILAREARDLARQRENLEKELQRKRRQAPPPAPAPPPVRAEPKQPPAPAPPPAPPIEPPPRFVNPAMPYKLPPIKLLQPVAPASERQISGDYHTTARILKETLAEFGIECEVANIEQGPVVTSYELLPAPGVRVERIVQLQNNLALMLKATSVRVQAPIPGKGVVGIEVPNSTTTKVYLREILEGEVWKKSHAAIPLVLGKDVGGNDLVADLAAMPHLLIAGATGSGKTVCMNSVLAGMLMSRTPEELRMILVDPKIVEFSSYKDIPHLATPVITDPKKVVFGLRWAINEMGNRYKLFARAGVRNIAAYNQRMQAPNPPIAGEGDEPFPPHVPYIVIVIDELADLMMVAQAEIESSIARLAQLSRAVGIHMILATQRPSVNVITGTIKANFPARISFQVAQKVDSRTILDTSGADKLLGRGDMLFLPPGSSKLIRAQGAMTTDEDIHSIVGYIKEQELAPTYEIAIAEGVEEKQGTLNIDDNGADNELLEAATNIIRETRRASVSLLQRRLKIGYNRAGRLMDVLEERGIVGPARGSDPREILIDLDLQADDNPMTEDGSLEKENL
ncbi:MAG: DNA translocase FtsK 4TM domain-containing protein [Kiritimatiellia bacterium]|nr:DNA translocase FtsK [Lentisphaerota bacterium]